MDGHVHIREKFDSLSLKYNGIAKQTPWKKRLTTSLLYKCTSLTRWSYIRAIEIRF